MRAVTSRLSPRRPTATSPARPDDASTPANVTSVSVKAKIRSDADGVPADARRVGQHVGVEQRAPARGSRSASAGRGRRARRTRSARSAWSRRRGCSASATPTTTAAPNRNSASPPASGVEQHRHVVRGRERGDRDQQDVVEQDRPAGDEAPQLVERVAREDRRAAALLVQRGALDVGEDDEPEEDGRDEEDEPGVARARPGRPARARSRSRPR